MPTGIQSPYSVTEESFESLFKYWRNPKSLLKWDCFFVLPPWLQAWCSAFGATADIYLRAVKSELEVIGIAPLLLVNKTASFLGDTDVCDYQDFVIAPGRSNDFFDALFDDLSSKDITALDLKTIRADSTAMTDLADFAAKRGCEVTCRQLDVSFELTLPATWDDYMLQLKGKQRHEIRRKQRRLEEAGDIAYRVVEDAKEVKKEIETFFELFKSNRDDKRVFMTEKMASFFRSLADSLAAEKMMKLIFLEINDRAAAAAMCFDDNSSIYLYNNGFDIRFNSLSVGTLCKVFSIKHSIEIGRHRYDFLKGAENYKSHLGGREVPLYECKILLNQ